MHESCTEKDAIRQLEINSKAMDNKLDSLLDNQKALASDLKQTLDRLASIIEEDIGTRKDVEQLKKDREILFAMQRADVARIDAIEIRNARCDGAGIFEKFPTIWDWYQQHQSLSTAIEESLKKQKAKVDKVYTHYIVDSSFRRMIPTIVTLLVALTSLWLNVDKITEGGIDPTSRTTVGVPK